MHKQEACKIVFTDHQGTNYAETRDRTGDLQIFSLTLPQLSYRGLAAWFQSSISRKPPGYFMQANIMPWLPQLALANVELT